LLFDATLCAAIVLFAVPCYLLLLIVARRLPQLLHQGIAIAIAPTQKENLEWAKAGNSL